MFILLTARMHGILRYSNKDAVLVLLSFLYGGLLLAMPSVVLLAIGMWWIANTVAHNFIHTPFFRSRSLNRAYALYLTAVMGFPQELWRERHLRHHRGDVRPIAITRRVLLECALVIVVWSLIGVNAREFFATVYLPGYAAGLGLCFLQGHFEHAGGTTSHYGWLYNRLFFNDGYHVEHHRRPGIHWARLPHESARGARSSRWPPVLRWLDIFTLEFLERIALRSRFIQGYVLRTHARAFQTLLPGLSPATRITIVGGGLFPRTALILRKLQPDASLTIVDASRSHLEIARSFLSEPIALREHFFDPRSNADADVLVIPLSFIGNRDAVYQTPPARTVLVHDWMWNVRGKGARISWLLLKRLNLVTR